MFDLSGTYSVDEYGHFFKDPWHQAVKRHHPVTSKQKVTVDVKVAAYRSKSVSMPSGRTVLKSHKTRTEDRNGMLTVVAVDLCAKGFHNLWLVEPFANPSKLTVTERSAFAWHPNIVRVLPRSLVGSDNGIVAVDSRRNTLPDTLAIVAAFNE